MHRVFRHCRHSFCHLKKFSWGGGGGGSVFSSVFGKFKHIRQKDFLLQKALSKISVMHSSFPLFFFFLNLLFLSRSHVTFRKDCGVPVLPWNHPYRCWGNLKGGPPNLAGHSKQTHGQTASRTPDKINRFTRRSITDR